MQLLWTSPFYFSASGHLFYDLARVQGTQHKTLYADVNIEEQNSLNRIEQIKRMYWTENGLKQK